MQFFEAEDATICQRGCVVNFAPLVGVHRLDIIERIASLVGRHIVIFESGLSGLMSELGFRRC